MAYDNTHLVKLAALKALAEKVKSDYALKTELSALSDKVDELVTAGGEPNKLEGVKVNGTALAIAEKMVDILIATGSANGTISVNKVDVAIRVWLRWPSRRRFLRMTSTKLWLPFWLARLIPRPLWPATASPTPTPRKS